MRAMKPILAALCLVVLVSNADAVQPEPVNLPPIDHVPALLIVVDLEGDEHAYTQADIEALGAYRLVTKTPWRDEEAAFEGSLLRDLLALHGLASVDAIQVTAENDFRTVLERDVWENVPVLVATRVNGHAHTRRERGPIQFVVPDDLYEDSTVVGERHLVWMAARIEPLK